MFEKLLDKLKELFQLNQPELDFGIYRIMHAKAGEISTFLEHDLLPQVKQALSGYKSVNRAQIEKEIADAISSATKLGVDPESTEMVKTLRAQLNEASNTEAIEVEVYEALYRFFRRYYTQGDFLSRRVYKKDVYAIPYEGEEVALHWANKDQYYIKSSETLTDYAFRLRPDDKADPMRVHFRVVGADEGEHNTVKVATGRQRVFQLADNLKPKVVDGELQIYFRYEHSDKKQGEFNNRTVEWFRSTAAKPLAEWTSELLNFAPTKSNETRTVLEKHLEQYTARNTFDYFIHKDLGGFLRRELDFFIKNEIMHLDDIDNASAIRADQYLAKLKAIKSVATKIITFLSEIEDFQRKLWLKKKFVTKSRWLIPLAMMPSDKLEEVLRNASQIREWEELLSIEEIRESLCTASHDDGMAGRFLGFPGLLVDTNHFSDRFVEEVLESITDLATNSSGELIHSDNFQALGLMSRRYKGGLDAIYIDPPYNSDSSEILYKNDYKHSSWLTLMSDRLALSRTLMKGGASIAVAIDDNEVSGLKSILEAEFGSAVETIVVRSNPAGRSTITGFSLQHEYVLFAWNGSGDIKTGKLEHSEAQSSRYGERDAIGPYEWVNFRKHGGFRRESPKMFYPIYIDSAAQTWRLPKMLWNAELESWEVEESPTSSELVSYPIDENGQERRWKWAIERLSRSASDVQVRNDRSGTPSVYVKARIPSTGVTPPTIWDKKEYSATDWGTRVFKDQFGMAGLFDYPKAPALVEDCLRVASLGDGDTVLDFFGGSGTTAVAVAQLNRQDSGFRRFVIVEMGSHFDTVIIPRVKKVAFAAKWKAGKPEFEEAIENGSSPVKMIQILELESYEDTLNNLDLKRPGAVEDLFLIDNQRLREEYILRYMLDVESRGSSSLLNTSTFADPRRYSLRIKSPGSDETKETKIDLIETFNWLLGLRVKHIAVSETFSAKFTGQDKRLSATLTVDDSGEHWFRQVHGVLPDGRSALVVWRTLTGNVEQDEAVLLAWFDSKGHLRSETLDVVYVNGDCNLAAAKPSGTRWEIEPLETRFAQLMFDGVEG